jgi:hypothetical protein
MVKEVLKKSVPDFVKGTREWTVLLRWISQKNIRTRDQLKKTVREEIKTCQEVMKTRMRHMRGGTNTRIVRQCAKRLDFLKVVRDRILKYL